MGKHYYPQAALVLTVRWENFGDDETKAADTTWRVPVLAKKVTVNINDYRSADTFRAEVEFKSFPFDPRTMRACSVEIYMQDMEKLVNADGSYAQIVPSADNVVFLGFVDEDNIRLDDDARMVTLEGRDQTAILIDTPFARGTVNLERAVDVVISSLLKELPATERMVVENRVDGPLPVIAAFAETKDGTKGRKNVARGESYWDVIQDIVSRAGLIAYVELDKLVLSKPRVLYTKDRIRPFIYGQNLTSLEFKRKLGRRKSFNLVVRGLVLGDKRVETARIPLEATKAWGREMAVPLKEVKLPEIGPDGRPLPEDQARSAPYISFLVPNVTSKSHLISIGEQLYEEIGRQELEGTLETKEMELCITNDTGGMEHFSILSIRNGTPISIEIDQPDLEALKRAGSVAQKQKYLVDRCYPPELAEVIANTMGKISTPFYTKAVEFSMDSEQGFSCKIEFINFIETENKAFTGKR